MFRKTLTALSPTLFTSLSQTRLTNFRIRLGGKPRAPEELHELGGARRRNHRRGRRARSATRRSAECDPARRSRPKRARPNRSPACLGKVPDRSPRIDAAQRRLAHVPERHAVLHRYHGRIGARKRRDLFQQRGPLMRLKREQQKIEGAERSQVVADRDPHGEGCPGRSRRSSRRGESPRRARRAPRLRPDCPPGQARRRGIRRSRRPRRPRSASLEIAKGDGQIRTAEWGFCRALPYHLATSPRGVMERVVGIEPTHRPWEGHRLPLHHTRVPGDPPASSILSPRPTTGTDASKR